MRTWRSDECGNSCEDAADAMSDLERRVLTIGAHADAREMRITISDTGKGIAASNIARIFDPFFTTKGERGTGLGLYITKQVIEEHGGTINVQTATAERLSSSASLFRLQGGNRFQDGSSPPFIFAAWLPRTAILGNFSRLITIGELSACFAHEVTNPLMLIRGH